MRRFTIVIIILCLFTTLQATAQDYKGKGRVTGTVVDEAGNPLEGVIVKLFSKKAEDGFEVKTDKKGKWMAAWVRSGDWDIDFVLFNYMPKQISVNLYEHQRNKPIEIVLEKAEAPVMADDMKGDIEEGNRLFEEEKYQESIGVFEEILVKHPDAIILHMNIGNSYFQMNDIDKAEEHYRMVLASEPDNVNAIMAVANCFINRGEDEKAKEMYSLLKIDQIDDPIVLYNIGTNHYGASNFPEAEKYYRKAIAVQPDFLDGYFQLGLTLLNLKNNTEAIAVFEKFLEIDSDSAKADQVKGFIDYLKK